MSEDLYPAPVEKRIYERLHRDREGYIEVLRRARSYQAEAAENRSSFGATFIAGAVIGAASTVAAVALSVAMWAAGS